MITAIVALAWSPGCYLSHGRGRDGPRDDAGRPRDGGAADAGRDAGRTDGGRDGGPGDAGAPRDAGTIPDARITLPDAGTRPACCTEWTFDRRVAVDAFDDDAVTPRLIRLDDRPAVVVTGPSDPLGPSGAHLVRYTRDLGAREPPVAVTRGSFTWGQPASAGDAFAVCWGRSGSGGNVVRAHTASGTPIDGELVLGTATGSPCVDGAYGSGVYAFAWAGPTTASPRLLNVRALDRATGALGVTIELPMDVSQAVSMAATDTGFLVAIPGPETTLAFLLRGASVASMIRLGPSRTVRVLWDGERAILLRVDDRVLDGARRESVWHYESFMLSALAPVHSEVLASFEGGVTRRFSATIADCGQPMLGSGAAELVVIEQEPTLPDELRLHTRLPSAPSPGTFVGDTSILAMGDDAYVAFSSTEPGAFRSTVKLDHWTCTEH